MALEIPSPALIREIQFILRREAGVPSYDPADPALPPLPTLAAAISSLDPSLPLHLRCSHCRGVLLRGLESTVCVFCGADRRRVAPAQTVLSFNSTAGCRALLESLGLDGSETVSLDTELDDSSMGQGSSRESLVLSGLLDLELRWPSDNEEINNSSINKVPSQLLSEKEENNHSSTKKLVSQSSYTSNVSAADLDTFFFDSKKEATSTAPDLPSEQLMPIKDTDGYVSPASQNFGFFDNFSSSGVIISTVKTKDGEFDDSFADWDANFQSANSETFAAESKSIDLFEGSTAEFASLAPAASVISPRTDEEHKPSIKGTSGEPSNDEGQVSSSNNWSSDDIWSQMSKEAVSIVDQSKGISETQKAESKNDLNHTTSVSGSWAQDDLWPTRSKQELNNTTNVEDNDDLLDDWQGFTSSVDAQGGLSNSLAQSVLETSGTNELNNTKNIDDNDDSFDAWQDFTSSVEPPADLSNSWAKNGTGVTTSGHASVMKPVNIHDVDFGGFLDSVEAPADVSNSWAKNDTGVTTSGHASVMKPVNIQDMDFGSFLDSDSFTGILGDQEGYQGANTVQSDSSVSKRLNGKDEKNDTDSTIPKAPEVGENFTATQDPDSSNSNVQSLLSQMHDLSFMLESTLSIPKKVNASGLNP